MKKNKEKNEERKGKKKHRVLRFILKFFLSIILAIVLFVGGFLGYSTYKNGWGIKGIIKTAVGASEKSADELGEFQTLILGVSEDIETPLTDTIMVAAYNPSTQKATLLSIPRDTFVGESKLRADSYDKINAIYQKEGAEGVLKKINKLTGLNVKNYIVISNNALVELVDAIGGVDFDVPINMDYDSYAQDLHIHLKKGMQKLDGEKAEWLVRFRKNNNYTTYSYEYGNDDFGRMRTQREFLKAVAEQTLQAKNITKIGDLIDIVKRNVKTNIKDWAQIKDYIPYAVDFDTDNLQMDSIPGDSQRIPAGTGLWFFLADDAKTLKIVEEMFVTQNTKGETNISTIDEKTKNKIKIELLNGSGDKEKLKTAKALLTSNGYKVTSTEKTSITYNTTIINKTKQSEEIMSDIKRILKTGVIASSSRKSEVDITLILGKDFEGK